MNEVFDPIRNTWVAATPEEVVRQTWIQRMILELKFPKELLAVEKELKALPHLSQEMKFPDRRIDLLVFMIKNGTFSPLLLIECKEGALKEEAFAQALSYNHYVKAPFVAVVNQHEIRLRSISGEMRMLPSYSELLESLHG